jgi:hypothetical protein
MDDTRLPQYLWPAQIRKLYKTLVQENSQAQRDFLRIYRALSAHKPPKPPEPEPPPPEPKPKPEITFRERLFRQSAEIRVIDGKGVTVAVDYSAQFFLSQTWENATGFCRTLCFEDGIVPEEYAYANTHNGKTYPFATAVFLYYSPEEFLRLCQLEVDTNSPHLLDGTRLHMERLPY